MLPVCEFICCTYFYDTQTTEVAVLESRCFTGIPLQNNATYGCVGSIDSTHATLDPLDPHPVKMMVLTFQWKDSYIPVLAVSTDNITVVWDKKKYLGHPYVHFKFGTAW